MPLLRRMARTAVVAGTAAHVSNNVSRRQAARWQQQPEPESSQPPPAPSSAAPSVDPIERVKELGALHEQGILTDEEFAAEKAKALAGTG